MHFEHHIRTEAHADLFTEIFPPLRFLAIDSRNCITRLDTCNFGRRILSHKTDDKALVVRFLDADHVKEYKEDKRKGDIHKRARKSNRSTSAHGLPQKIILRREFSLFNAIRIFASHGYITAKRNRRDAVFRLAFLEAEKLFAKAHRERIYADLVPLGNDKMSQFVNSHEEAQGQKPQNKHQQII